MKRLHNRKQWAYDFLFGQYRGSPLDYVMAIAIVMAMMAVLFAHAVSQFPLPESVKALAEALRLLVHGVLFH